MLGLVYVASFASFLPQIVGLIGAHGIAPAYGFLNAFRGHAGPRLYFEIPTVFWFGVSDTVLVAVCLIGCLSGLIMASGYFTRLAAALCWLLLLSIVAVGQPFSNFQWDALLLESGFLALFAGVPLLAWAYRFLLFRLMFESGLVKLLSHDPNWRNFHALRFHFMTQPLPNPVAWYAYRLPASLLDSSTAVTLGIEFIAPLLFLGSKRLRWTGVGLLALLQLVILLTGNYAFFNYLTLALCLWGFDDRTFAHLRQVLGKQILFVGNKALRGAMTIALIVFMTLGAVTLFNMAVPGFEKPFAKVLSILAPFDITNTYGLFAMMTTTRPEVVIEGSNDEVSWKEYSFRYKPGDLHRGLPWVAPHQPRLDWQMWFAALGTYEENTWVGGLIYRLLTGEPSVLKLMDPAPFPKPPRYIRAMLYDYQFTTRAERARSGNLWRRTLRGPWFGPVSLRAQ